MLTIVSIKINTLAESHAIGKVMRNPNIRENVIWIRAFQWPSKSTNYSYLCVLFFILIGFCFFFFFLLSNITLYTYFTVYLFISAEISLSLVFTVMNIATRNIQIQVFAETCFSFILGKILGVGLLGLLVNVCLIF